MSTDLNALAAAVQAHVAVQPWGRYGERPVPLELTFNGNEDDGGPRWSVRFVKAVRGGRRVWGHAQAPTLGAALTAARDAQRAATPTLMDTLGGAPDA